MGLRVSWHDGGLLCLHCHVRRLKKRPPAAVPSPRPEPLCVCVCVCVLGGGGDMWGGWVGYHIREVCGSAGRVQGGGGWWNEDGWWGGGP